MCSAVFITGLDLDVAAETVGYFIGPMRSARGGPDGRQPQPSDALLVLKSFHAPSRRHSTNAKPGSERGGPSGAGRAGV
jgi:hypothetical protein